MAKDYYRILGVGRDAGPEEIKKAFRRMARENHPDANPNDPKAEARFRDAAEAYEVLSDPERRRRHDRGDTIDLGDIFSGFGGMDDLLRSVFGDSGLFGGGGVRTAPPRGRDVLTRVQVSLEEAAFGLTADVEFRTNVTCESCGGDGAAPGSHRSNCPTCGGSGAVRVARRSFLGTMMSVTTCETCTGVGSVVSSPCPSCRGSGVASAERSVKVEIPAGISTGTRLRLNREGEAAGVNGRAGDLFVEVVVAPHPQFERHGDDLIHRTKIGIAEAALGSTIEVPLIEGGNHEVSVPPGTQPGWVVRLPGLGMSRLGRRGRGDLLVEVGVEVPTTLTPEQQDLLTRFAELNEETISGHRRRRRR